MSETDMLRLWMSPQSFKECRLTSGALKSLLERQPGTLLIYMVHGRLSRWGMKVASLEDGEENLRTFWEPREPEEFTQTYRYCGQSLKKPDGNCVVWPLPPERPSKAQAGDSL